MTQHEVPTLTADIPELPTRYQHTPDTPGFDDLTFSEADRDKLHRAAHPNLVTRALAGDQTGIEEMRRLHVVRWEHERGMR